MKTRLFVSAVIVFAWGSTALAEEAGFVLTTDNTAADTPTLNQASGPTCFKLEDQPNACVIVGTPIVNYQAPSLNVIDMNGAWRGPGNEIPYIYIYSDSQYASGYTIFVDMSLLNRPDGFGYFIDASTIAVVFPDDRDYTGKIQNGNSILWSNNSVWTKR
jgi:hypothetical protein